MKNTLTLLTALLLASGGCRTALHAASLETFFDNPPADARPSLTQWFAGGLVTEEGMAADYKAYAGQGVGAMDWMDARYYRNVKPVEGLPKPLEYMGKRWYELVGLHGKLAAENGMTLRPHNHLGNYIGIPQTHLEHLPKEVLFSATEVQGGLEVSVRLPQPETRPITLWPGTKDYYRDIAVYAYPAPAVTRTAVHAAKPAISVNAPFEAAGLERLLDGEPTTFWGGVKPVAKGDPVRIDFTFAETFEAAGLSLLPAYHKGPKDCSIEVSEDGASFREVAKFTLGVAESKRVAFPPVKAKVFRLVIQSVHKVSPPYDTARAWLKQDAAHIAEAEWLAPGEEPFARQDIRLLFQKMGRIKGNGYPWSLIEGNWYDPAVEARVDVRPDQVIDITRFMMPDGTLKWNAPSGKWTVVRMGYGLTAGQIAAAGPIAAAVDLMSKDASKLAYDLFCPPFLDALGENRKRVTHFHEDSFETDCSNWTPGFREEFQKRRGYDLFPWMEVLRGRVVGSQEQSERFLWDYRRTIADLVTENHYTEMTRLSNKDGILFIAQGTAGLLCPVDPILLLGQSDAPAGEFWYRTDMPGKPRRFNGDQVDGVWHIDQLKVASSAARIYGKKTVYCEAGTNGHQPWISPFDLRYAQDFALMDGANLFSYYNAPHQPYVEPKRAGAFEIWGTHWSRNNSVWNLTKPFMDYVARCSAVLRESTPRCDVLYFYGEDVPNVTFKRETLIPAIPHGWNYDFVNADVLVHRAKARDGRIQLDSGMEYRMLVMPPNPRLTPEVAKAVAKLIESGVKVVGPRPTTSPSLTGWPKADAEIAGVAKLWDQGKAAPASDLAAALEAAGIAKDFSFTCKDRKAHFNFAHHQAGGIHIYMVANEEPVIRDFTASFRVSGLVPEIWDADAGTRARVADFTDDGKRISLPMTLAENQSLFVVFRPKGDPAAAPAVKKEPKGGAYYMASGWTLRFPAGHGAPESIALDSLFDLSKHPEAGVKYFSGTATYRNTFQLPGKPAKGEALMLNLGKVYDGAELLINGQPVRNMWAYPFEADITPFVKAGENVVEVKVSNVWHNRFIGDSTVPPDQRVAQPLSNIEPLFRGGFHPGTPFSKDIPLRPSGLIGPVRLEFNRMVDIN